VATNLEQYLRANADGGITEFRISARVGDAAGFYIHPMGKDGATVDFAVEGNQLVTLGVACPNHGPVELEEIQKAVNEVYDGDIDAALAGGLIDQEIADELKAAKA
jgi:hypothetical protein